MKKKYWLIILIFILFVLFFNWYLSYRNAKNMSVNQMEEKKLPQSEKNNNTQSIELEKPPFLKK